MKNRMITTTLVAATALLALADAASAYYSPRLGRFLSRDPVSEPGAALVRGGRQPATRFIPRDPIRPDADPNRYAAVKNNPLNLVDPHGAAPMSPSAAMAAEPGAQSGDDCGVEIHQAPFCLFGNPGHTWLTWGMGNPEETSDCPAQYIHNKPCEKKYIDNKWRVSKVDTGVLHHTQESCSNASCAGIRACLKLYEDDAPPFHLCAPGFPCDKSRPEYHCRHSVQDAMSKCCLKQGALVYVDILAPIRFCCSKCARGEE